MQQGDLDKLIFALETVLSPGVDHNKRTAAITLCETYKNHEQCAQIGFTLAEPLNTNASVRYFGWQLIKHVVRLKWTEKSKEDKVQIQKQLLAAVHSCPETEPVYIKSVISGVLTELVKHVWPQQWPTMLDDVFNLCENHKSSTVEIVLMMLLSLAEDVVLYQNITSKPRARDLRQAFTVATERIFEFFNGVISYRLSSLATPNGQKHLIATALRALGVYVEWVNLDFIFTDKPSSPLPVIFRLLDPSLGVHLESIECLLAIANRKGSTIERQAILKLADKCFVEQYVSAIKISSSEESFDETFSFLKSAGKLMGALSGQIIAVFPEQKESKTEFINTLNEYKPFLDVLYHLANHESRMVAHPCVTSWVSLLRHQELRKDPTLLSLVPHLLNLVTLHLCKDYSQQNQFTCVEELDFSDDEELLRFMKSFRSSCIQLLRYSTIALPLDVADACFATVYENLENVSPTDAKLLLKFEGLHTYLETVTSCVVSAAEDWNSKHRLPIAKAEELMFLFTTKKIGDPEVQAIFFNCAYSLCKLVALASNPRQHFKLLLDRAFETLDATAGQYTISAVSSLRRQIAVVLIRISKYYPNICLPLMEHLTSMIMQRLHKNHSQFSPHEKVSMFESLILISNELKNFVQQTTLIKNIMATTENFSQSPEFRSVLQSPVDFAKAIGFMEPSANEACTRMRTDIYYYITLTSAVLCRTQVPEDEKARISGGFYVNGNLVHPCTEHVGLAVELIFILARYFSSMWTSAVKSAVHPGNVQALAMRESEKRTLMCVNVDQQPSSRSEYAERSASKKHWETLQTFLHCNIDNCYNSLGLASKVFASVFYFQPVVYQIAVEPLVQNVATLPMPQLRGMLRQFFAEFLKNCPVERTEEVACPILSGYCEIVMERLRPRWEAYGVREAERIRGAINGGSQEFGSDEKPEEEILEEQILRNMTREHLDLLVTICVNKNPPSKKTEDMSDPDQVRCLGMAQSTQLTDTGVALANTGACEDILTHALVAMSWHDTTSCHKSVSILWPLLKLLMRDKPSIFTDDVTYFVFESILRGLNRHGQFDGCQTQLTSLALLIIQGLPGRINVFLGILNSALPQMESQISDFLETFHQRNDKQKKITFKKLVGGIIEQHVGQQFKEEPKMDVFAPFFARSSKRATKNSVDEVNIDGLAQLFKPQ
uniref:Exportin-5-like n=1 Tax=Phallusia mammillata TaxID=59560 RepID=A0A6F9DXV2_9ASCI|nr:exportin-5-like [Phallusia mammillata]